MNIIKRKDKFLLSMSPNELSLIMVSDFLQNMVIKINKGKSMDKDLISSYIKQLADKSVDSHDYEYFASILDLYDQFDKDCEFRFILKPNLDHKNLKINNLSDLSNYKDDPPDVIVFSKGLEAEFEIKRYRDKIAINKLYKFLEGKIVNHYSEMRNYLILLQPAPGTSISLSIFKKLHSKLIKKNIKGRIGFSFNNSFKEMVLVFVYPELGISKRPYISEKTRFAELLNQ